METKNDDKGKWIMDIDEAKKRFKRELLFYKQNIEYHSYKGNYSTRDSWRNRFTLAVNLYFDTFLESSGMVIEISDPENDPENSGWRIKEGGGNDD